MFLPPELLEFSLTASGDYLEFSEHKLTKGVARLE